MNLNERALQYRQSMQTQRMQDDVVSSAHMSELATQEELTLQFPLNATATVTKAEHVESKLPPLLRRDEDWSMSPRKSFQQKQQLFT